MYRVCASATHGSTHRERVPIKSDQILTCQMNWATWVNVVVGQYMLND